MFLLSKTVTNHLRTNLFSTSAITFFAGCSAFVQISTDNIKGIIDSSLSPYSSLPKNNLFIKTGKSEPYMGGASFTVPVEVTVTDAEVKDDGPKEVRIITPLGWFTKFDHTLAKERAARVAETKADYGSDYCIPMTGLRSIYTNFWVRPKIRFKGVWDAQIKGAQALVPRENKTYKRECAEYTEEAPIDNEFLGKLMHDYIYLWFNNTSKAGDGEGLITFVKGSQGDAKEQKEESIKKTLTPFLKENGDKREKSGSENCWQPDKKEKWCGAKTITSNSKKNEFGFDNKSSIKFHGKTNITEKKAPEGIFGGWKKQNQKVTKIELLAGDEAKRMTESEYLRKHQERRKSKMKIEMENMLLNSQHLDVRKILSEFRKDFQKHLIQPVAELTSEVTQVTQEVQETQEELWEPLEHNPWLDEAAKRTIRRNSNGAEIAKLYDKYRYHQDNQLLRRKRSPNEKDQLKFNVHRSVQISNIGLTQVSSEGKDSTFDGHSFKVIAYEDEAERGIVNPIKIIKGNPLFRARENQENLLKEFIKNFDEPFYAPSMIPMLRMISRAKFSDSDIKKEAAEGRNHKEYVGIRDTLHWWIDYLQYPWRDTWNIPAIKAKEYEPIMYNKLQLWLEEIFNRTWSSNGSRIIFNFTSPYEHYILGKQLLPQLKIPINNFKTIGYIDQPTASFTVVSPEYARIHGLEPISDEQYKNFRKLVNNLWLSQETWEKYYGGFTLNDENKKHLVNVGEKQMIIVGIGQTPDFLYPVQSWITIQPDKNKEALIYVDNYGFNDLKERGTIKYQEQYITIGLPENVLSKGPKEISAYRDKLKKFIDDKMKNYKDYYHLTLLGEDAGNEQLYSIRSAYIPTFQSRVWEVSYILSSAVYVVVLLLLFILIKKYLKSNLYLFGNFVANGMIKVDVLLNICLFTFVPLALATTLGFLLSWAMQSTFYSIVSAFWYLTVQMNPLGASNALYFILKVLAFMIPISYFYSRYTLKDNTSDLLKTTSSMKINKLTLLIYRIIYKFSSMWKFKSVLVFNTLGQSGILSMTSIIGFIFLNFFLHNHGQFAKVSKAEKILKTHEFEMDFETPTEQSGEYKLATYQDIGKKISNGAEDVSKATNGDHKYYIYNHSETDLLGEVWSQYKGNKLNGFQEKEACKYNETKKTRAAHFKNLFCLIYENGQNNGKWKVKEPNGGGGGGGKNVFTDNPYYVRNKQVYRGKQRSMKELLEEYPNYWIISSRDQSFVESSLNFFKNKTLMRILIDLDVEFTSDSGYQKYNIWDQQSKELEKIQPLIQKMDENNYNLFIQDLVRSRYGPLFVSKFMNKHEVGSSSSNGSSSSSTVSVSSVATGASQILSKQGEKYKGKRSWYFKGTDIGREDQLTNVRYGGSGYFGWDTQYQCHIPNKNLTKSEGKYNCSKEVKDAFEDGIYYLDVQKIIFFNDASDVDKDLLVIYNPEFLYLIFTVVEEFAKQREEVMKNGRGSGPEYTLPIKYTFGNIIHSKSENGTHLVTVSSSGSQEPAYYSSSMKNGGFDPAKTPDGDQTYTWSKGMLTKKHEKLSPDTRIVGLKQDARGAFYKLWSGDQLINSKLYSNDTKVNSETTSEYPIVINQFAAKKYGLRVGDTITFKPENHYTRFTCKLKPVPNGEQQTQTASNGNGEYCQLSDDRKTWTNSKIKEHTLKVVGIFDSYYKESYFMSQKDLNTILGLNPDKGFNGIFAPKREGRYPEQLSISLSSYSVSGIYTNIQQKLGNAAFINLLRNPAPFKEANKQRKEEEIKKMSDEDYNKHYNYKILENTIGKSSIGYDEYLKTAGNGNGSSGSSSSSAEGKPKSQRESFIEGEAQKLVSRVSQAFSEYPNPMGTALKGLMNHSIVGDVIFNNLSNLTDNISYLIIFVIFPLLLVSLITIVYLLIKDLENVFVTMKLIGFGAKENSTPIIFYLLFLLFLSSLAGSLIVPAVLEKYVSILFNSQSILLPLIASNGLMLGVFGVLGVIYLFSIFKSYVKIKGIYLPVSIKLLVG